jgi:hypothetical protein
MNTLEEDRLKDLIQTLQLAQQVGFSSSSSPIGWLLEAGTDICLQISTLLKEGTKEKKNNPEVKFNYRVSDPLGNPKSFKVYTAPKVFWNPQLSEYFKKLASFFVKVKNGDNDALDFMSKEAKKPVLITSDEQSDVDKEDKVQLDLANIAKFHYHRRQKKKRSISKHSKFE